MNLGKTQIYTNLGNNFTKSAKRVDAAISPVKLIFTLTATLFLAGVLIFSFPKFFAFIFAGFLMMIGCVAAFLAWKFYKFKQQVDEKLAKFSSGVSVVMDGMPEDFDHIEDLDSSVIQIDKEASSEDEDDISFVDYKKITWH